MCHCILSRYSLCIVFVLVCFSVPNISKWILAAAADNTEFLQFQFCSSFFQWRCSHIYSRACYCYKTLTLVGQAALCVCMLMGAENVDDALERVFNLWDLTDLFLYTEVITETSFWGALLKLEWKMWALLDEDKAILWWWKHKCQFVQV